MILVRPGTYSESLDYLGKTIEVRSTLGATMKRIQGNPGGPVVSIVSGEGPQTLLQGFGDDSSYSLPEKRSITTP